jgi:hypothetical protein
MVDVTVNATWRLSRVEFNLPHSVPQGVVGYGEVLLQEAAGQEASIMRRRSPNPMGGITPDPKTYGSMPSDMVVRGITPEVLAEEIQFDGNTVSFEATLGALAAFFAKWRAEDAAKPVEPPPLPEGAALTPVPQLGPVDDPTQPAPKT